MSKYELYLDELDGKAISEYVKSKIKNGYSNNPKLYINCVNKETTSIVHEYLMDKGNGKFLNIQKICNQNYLPKGYVYYYFRTHSCL